MPRISTKESLEHFKKHNQDKDCSVKHCDSKRAGVSKYCSRHQRNNWRYGDPLARRIFPQEMEVERSKCEHVVKYNKEHPAIDNGIDYFNQWMINSANEIPGISATEHFQRLHDDGVTGEELLIEAATVYMFQRNNPDELPEHQPRPLMMAIGLAVLGYRQLKPDDPNYRNYISELRIEPKKRREVGRIIWRDLGSLIVRIAREIEEHDKGMDVKGKLIIKK